MDFFRQPQHLGEGESNEKQPYQFFAVFDDRILGSSVIHQDVI
jgi:hypothetical protein